MNLLEKSIPYRSIIMRCDSINRNAFSEAEECFSIVKYRPEMKSVWIEIQKAAGQFERYSDADIADYFEKTFLYDSSEIDERCFFLKDNVEKCILVHVVHGFQIKEKELFRFFIGLQLFQRIEIAVKEVMNSEAYKRLKNTAVQ